jgi:hypothetical protein
MTPTQTRQLRNGVYRIHWHDPDPAYGPSVGTIGRAEDGTPWIACSNWTGTIDTYTRSDDTNYQAMKAVALVGDIWNEIERVELIEAWGQGWD